MEWSFLGERVREARLAAGLSQDQLGHLAGLERSKVAKIESGDRRVDALELGRLATALGVPMSHFLEARPPAISRRAPLTADTDTAGARDAYRLDARLTAWLRDVRQVVELDDFRPAAAITSPVPVTDAAGARRAAGWLRTHLGLGDEPIPSLMSICARAGQLVLVTDLPGDGASLVDGDIAVAVVGLSQDPGRRRSTAAHELGHMVLGDAYSTDLHLGVDREDLVDAFAAELLLPVDSVRAVGDAVGRPALVELAARYRTSWSLAVRQAEQAGVATRQEAAKLRSSTPTRVEFQEALGWTPQPDLDGVRVPPSYATAVVKAWHRRLITSSRAVELMHGQITGEDLPEAPGA
ncbi:helix-turn-helix domain-containing protein [Actinokineospora spheciospongiae]|uniref:helix-turn-helix domain-containing protein n=1 Tax=Actinokineospora spheciospongiae TaxID=909613 RepID=UPI000D71B016|nr:XRE family transcriptional regulator [Actinokineospora spheciospongiae]PWW64660.1 uncharacterized protein DUF955 [Actinokineospora spheciospongiae]